ncbi:carboxypeptidase-like regulatory domain-containing protein [bacterium]|nr:carboxypeptidase-like regulatory domain-containing protein [bacterium]
MKIRILLPGLLICFGFFFANAQKDYKGIVIDGKTNETLPYVNIGISGKGIGTVSDEEGVFHLNINVSDYSSKDTLVFSSIGYKNIKKALTDLQFIFNEYPKISMQAEVVRLNEVVITNYQYEEEVGYRNYGEKVFGYWKEDIALGGELATKIRVKKGLRRLDQLFFEVLENPSDSVLIRVNIYAEDGFKEFPKSNLNTSGNSILYTILEDTKVVKIELTDFEIHVENDFIVSLELLKIYGDTPIGLVLAASNNTYTHSYRKYVSQGDWEKIPNAAMAYHLMTTHFSKQKRKAKKVKKSKVLAERNISGFVFFAGNAQSKVNITNLNTNDQVETNEKGRYSLIGNQGDILTFEAAGFKKLRIKLMEKTTINVHLEQESN